MCVRTGTSHAPSAPVGALHRARPSSGHNKVSVTSTVGSDTHYIVELGIGMVLCSGPTQSPDGEVTWATVRRGLDAAFGRVMR